MHAFHRISGVVHGVQGLLVDVCRFDGIHLLFELHNLVLGLFEVFLVQLLSSQGCFGGYTIP